MKHTFILSSLAVSALLFMSCSGVRSSQVLLSDEAGHHCDQVANITFHEGTADNAVIVRTDDRRQTIEGFGGSLTESSAFVLACLNPEQRAAILHELFSEDGANFSLTRTQIGASDFSVEGKYSLCETPGDTALLSFSLDRDKEGFSRADYPQIRDEHYDLFHLMKEVAAIKSAQTDTTWRIIANTWTAPHWMKDNGKYYERENGWGRGGALLKEYYDTYARYLVRYFEEYAKEGIYFWGTTPVNEPMGNDGGWESMDFPPAVEADFIAHHYGPALEAAGLDYIKILGFDQNIFEMGPYTAAIYGDSLAAAYTTGMAIHWYGSTFSCFPQVLDSVHALYPDKMLLHTEGCIDNIGRPAWPGVSDPVGFQEEGWFECDSFWWNACATDWAYSTPFWPELHPAYSAVHRYAEYIIDGINHWMAGFADWNIVLDSVGGPNHVENYCGAPVMVDYATDRIYFTPYYYALKQFSLSMRPGDIALGVEMPAKEEVAIIDAASEAPIADPLASLHLCAVEKADGSIAVNMLNKAKEPVTFPLQIGEHYAIVTAPANSVETIIVRF